MSPYKHIERCIAGYLGARYRDAVEIGVGANFVTAEAISLQGCRVLCTDRIQQEAPPGIPFVLDDLFHPREELYRGAKVLYAIRPGVEMVPALITLARQVNADLLVYHPGDELYLDGGEVIECGVPLHRYHTRSE